MGLFDGVRRLFTRRMTHEQIALELTQALAEAFADDPEVVIGEPMTWEQTAAWLKSIEVEDDYEEEGD